MKERGCRTDEDNQRSDSPFILPENRDWDVAEATRRRQFFVQSMHFYQMWKNFLVKFVIFPLVQKKII